MIEFGHCTHVGLRREHNEDTYYADADLGLWLVADGMGGHENGEVASALARDTLVAEIARGAPLANAIQTADEEIIKRMSGRRWLGVSAFEPGQHAGETHRRHGDEEESGQQFAKCAHAT